MLWSLKRELFTALLFIAVAGCGAGGAGTNVTVNGGGTSGSLDATFGTGGKVTTDTSSQTNGGDGVFALAIQSDGKIVAAGLASDGGINSDFAVVRYNTDGSLDSTFGTGGKETTTITGGSDSAYALGIQSDGKIVAAGSANDGSHNVDFAVVRYLP